MKIKDRNGDKEPDYGDAQKGKEMLKDTVLGAKAASNTTVEIVRRPLCSNRMVFSIN